MAVGYILVCVSTPILFLDIVNHVKGQICYDFDCHYTPHCDSDYDNSTGVCHGKCSKGWYGPTCQLENVALGKPVYQNIPYTSNWRTGYIVDGNTSLSVCVDKGGLQGMDAFVEIDMKAVYTVKKVTIYYRKDGRNSLQGFSVGASMIPDGDISKCYQHQVNESIPPVINIECSVRGRYLYIMNSRSSPPYPKDYGLAAELELCEVLVFACAKGTFGDQCENQCHCYDHANCNDRTGYCPESSDSICEFGWAGERCDIECISTYGLNCSQKCEDRHCAGATTCNPVNGSCDLGCEDEYVGVDCSHTKPKNSLQVGESDDGLSKVTVGLIGVICGCAFSIFIALFIFCCFKCSQRRKIDLSSTRSRDTDVYATVYDNIHDTIQPSRAVSNRAYGGVGPDATTTLTPNSGRALPDIALRPDTIPAESHYMDMDNNSRADTVRTQPNDPYEDINDMKRGTTLNIHSDGAGCEYQTMKLDHSENDNDEIILQAHESNNTTAVNPDLPCDGAGCGYQNMKLEKVEYDNDKVMLGAPDTKEVTSNLDSGAASCEYQTMRLDNANYEKEKLMPEASELINRGGVITNMLDNDGQSSKYQNMNLDHAGHGNDENMPDNTREVTPNIPSVIAGCEYHDMSTGAVNCKKDEKIIRSDLPVDIPDLGQKSTPRKDEGLSVRLTIDNESTDSEL